MVSSKTIYEDDMVKVIMDIYPESNGHVLLIPKKHMEDFESIEEKYLIHIFKVAKIIKNQIFEILKPTGIKFIINYGSTQLIKHFHLHLIPVYKDHKIENVDTIYHKLIQKNKA